MDLNEIEMITNKMHDKKYLNYLSQFDEEEQQNYLKKWMEYKFSNLRENKDIQYSDLDVSKMAIITYYQELNQFDEKKYGNNHVTIVNQGDHMKYSLKLETGLEMRGDWLTSPLHIIKLYMGLLWENMMETDGTTNEEYISLYQKTTRKHLLYAPKGTWEKYCYENIDIVWNSFDDVAENFMTNVVLAGNFISMPIYVNPSRCKSFGGDDTLDTLLWKMYCCFKLSNNRSKLDTYLASAFRGKNEIEARKNVCLWMEVFNNSWNDFVKYNYLTDAVEHEGDIYGKPIDLRSGKVINLEIGDEYNPEPKDIKECREMLNNYNILVSKRTSDIYNLFKK